MQRRYPGLPAELVRGVARRHGTLRAAGPGRRRKTLADLGEDFGDGLTAREIDYLVARRMGAHRRRRAVAAHQVRPAHEPRRRSARVAAYVAKALAGA